MLPEGQNYEDTSTLICDNISYLFFNTKLQNCINVDKMIFFKISTFYDVSNLPNTSGMKGQIASHCTYFYMLFPE